MKKLILILALMALPLAVSAQAGGCYAVLEGDTLRIGNSMIERSFFWNDGNISTIALADKAAGIVRPVNNGRPDFILGREKATGGALETEFVTATALHPAYLLARISYSLGTLEVRREYRIYENVSAIACDTWLRGTLNAEIAGRKMNAADHKNIESAADMSSRAVTGAVLDHLQLGRGQWHCKAVEFRDVTDWNDNLVSEEEFISYRKLGYRGNLLFMSDAEGGVFFLKEAPCSSSQPSWPGEDFTSDFGHFCVTGLGIRPADITPERWIRIYGCVTGVYAGGEREALCALRAYQKTIRTPEDMIMLNTWGDRSQDSKVNEAFCLAELERAARLGITIFQIDDGWQCGKSPNSKVAKGSFKNIWDNPDYWTPDPVKYPRGLAPIVERGRELGIEIGLWFNPSVQDNFADWEKDAAALVGLWKQYGIRVFKIDGLQLPCKEAEQNLRLLFDRVREETGDAVIFNLDATAGRRAGYHWFGEYGNIFLENRYTDWGNYYPYRTLRNLWMLSRYVPAEKLQIEFLNKWRNADKYPEGDACAPANYSFDYLAAITFAAQPLAWMEASNLPEEAFATGERLKEYRKLMGDFHSGIILPVGDEPSGHSWTGFQSITGSKEGYLLVYREDNPACKVKLQTWLPEGCRVRLKPVTPGRIRKSQKVRDGFIDISLKDINSYIILKYKVK